MKKKIDSGVFLIIVGVVYLIAGIIDVFVYRFCPTEYLQLAFVAILASPILIKPIGDFVGVQTIWNSFRKNEEMKDNVVKFPETTQPVQPPTSNEYNNREYYRVGYDSGRDMVTLTLLDQNNYAVSTLSMNKSASEQMIRMIRSAFPKASEVEND